MVVHMNRLRELRLQHGLKQIALAKELGITQASLSAWETGKTSPDTRNLKKLADMYGVSTDYLLGRDETTDAEPVYTQDDPEFWELREQLRREPGMRTLFSLTKNATSEDMKKMTALIKAYKGDDYDDPC